MLIAGKSYRVNGGKKKYAYRHCGLLSGSPRRRVHICDGMFKGFLRLQHVANVELLTSIIKTEEHRRRVMKAVVQNPTVPFCSVLFGFNIDLRDDYGKRIFEFKSKSYWGRPGMPNGHSVTVYKAGFVVTREFIKPVCVPSKEIVLAFSPDLAARIQTIIQHFSDKLETIPNDLDNGSCDGAYELFRFGEKKINALNICRTTLSELQRIKPGECYYEEIRDNMFYENMVLDIYDDIATVINRDVPGINMWLSRSKDI